MDSPTLATREPLTAVVPPWATKDADQGPSFESGSRGRPPTWARALTAGFFLLVSWTGARFGPSETLYRFRASGSQTQPIPWQAASQHPTYSGGLGMISAIRVGREHTSAASNQESSMASLKWRLSYTRSFSPLSCSCNHDMQREGA